jgi:hypothetical protein
MTDITAIVDNYFEMWNETDPGQRAGRIATAWAPEAGYVDPMFAVDGYPGLDGMVDAVHQQFPGHRFRLVGAVDTHHDRATWGWELVGPDGGAPVATGVDYAVLAGDGRLRDVTGFFVAAGS